jgi:IS605 OrfB family transposase
MIRTIKIKLYPNRTQMKTLYAISRLACDLYNIASQQYWQAYESARSGLPKVRNISWMRQGVEYTEMKRDNPEFDLLPTRVKEGVLKTLYASWKSFYGHRKAGNMEARPPREFIPYYLWRTLKFSHVDTIGIDETNKIKIVRLGEVKYRPRIKWHAPDGSAIVITNDMVNAMDIVREGKSWYALLQCDVPEIRGEKANGGRVAVKVGASDIVQLRKDNVRVALSERFTAERKSFIARELETLRRTYQLRDTKQVASYRYRQINAAIAKRWGKIRRQRQHWARDLVSYLLKRYEEFIVERVDIPEKQTYKTGERRTKGRRDERRNRADAIYAEFINWLEYRADQFGAAVFRVDESDTRECSTEAAQELLEAVS